MRAGGHLIEDEQLSVLVPPEGAANTDARSSRAAQASTRYVRRIGISARRRPTH